MNKTNKKIIVVGTTIMIMALLILTLVPQEPQAKAEIQPNSLLSGGNSIVQGKITPSGDLFIILEEVPLTGEYNVIPAQANNPNFELLIYSPDGGNVTLQTQIAGEKAQNFTVQTPAREMTQYDFSLSLTPTQGNLNLSIQGVGYYNVPEKFITPSPIPFYSSGQLTEFAFLTILTATVVLVSFAIALATIHRAKYFPPIKPSKMAFLTLAIIGYIAIEYTQNYYQAIEQPWYYLEIPLIILLTIVFLSYIPQPIQRGILIRFLDERSKGEVYTDIMPILTSESEPTKTPEGWRSANMEYIDRKSYSAFLRRLIGFHVNIIFHDGQLPDMISKPKTIKPETRRTNHFKRMNNKKRESTGYDFGYLIAGKNPDGSQDEISEEKIEVFPDRRILRKKRYLKIPLSGHHSTYIEQFLAGLADARTEGDRIEVMKEQLASKEAQILSGTYLNDTMIITRLGEILGIKDKPPTPKEPEKVENKTQEEEHHE